ncbi:MAG: radical SAM protein [Candidatus Sericytochromatia bacterium]
MPASSASAVLVGLVQITEPAEFLVYLPYAVGLLQAYVMAHAPDPARYRFLLPQFQRKSVELAAAELAQAQVVGFSSYVWNYAYNLNLAKALKQRNPEILIVFGGPQVPDAPAEFLAQYAFIDICVHGEGEITFLHLLESLPDKAWKAIPGISYRDPDGACITQERLPRTQDLDSFPSPYLSGIFEPLMQQHPEIAWCGVWETNRGCPFSCTFCDWGSNLNSKIARFGIERLKQEMEWFGRNRINFLFCADANFGILPRDLEIAGEMVAAKERFGFPHKVVTQMTKNQPERAFEAHRILHQGGMLISATLSFQAVNPEALRAIKRDNISLTVFQQVLRRFVQHGIPTYTDMLVGLPGDTYDSFLEGVAALISMGQHDEQRFFPTYLLPNAEMASPEYRQRYGIETITIPFYSPYLVAHGNEGLVEEYEMVVATSSMPRRDWVRARALAWMTQILYYSKLLQLPLLLVHELAGIPHHELLRAFFEKPLPGDLPVLRQLRQFLLVRAQAVIEGQPESCMTRHPQTGREIWMPATDYVMAQLLFGPDKLGLFFQESARLLASLVADKHLPPGLLAEALHLSRAVFEGRLPHKSVFSLELSYNLWGFYQQICRGGEPRLEAGVWRVTNVADAEGNYTLEEVSVSRHPA